MSSIILSFSVKIKSIHVGDLRGSKLVGSLISWESPNDQGKVSNSLPSVVLSPSGH